MPHDEVSAGRIVKIIYCLYIGGVLTGGVTSIIGVIAAYIFDDEQAGWAHSHYRFQIRTFWLALLATVLLAPLSFLLIGAIVVVLAPVLWLGGKAFVLAIVGLPWLWLLIRCGRGLRLALRDLPHPFPRSLGFG